MEKKTNDSLKIKHRHDTLWIHVTPWRRRSGQHEGSEVTVPHCLRGGKEEGLNSAEEEEGQWARTKPDEGTTGETVLDDRSEEKPRHFLRNPEARRFSSCSFTVSHLSVLVQRHRLPPLFSLPVLVHPFYLCLRSVGFHSNSNFRINNGGEELGGKERRGREQRRMNYSHVPSIRPSTELKFILHIYSSMSVCVRRVYLFAAA